MTAADVIIFIAWGLSVFAIVQSLEFLYLWLIKKQYQVWDWNIISLEISDSKKVQNILGFFLSNHHFIYLNLIRIVIAAIGFMFPITEVYVALLFLHLLTMVRWFGCFNGGSDYMNTLLLWTTSFGLYSQRAAHIALWVIAIHVCWSYFRSGLVKIKSPSWRKGKALSYFVHSHMYEKTSFLTHSFFVKIVSYSVITFEIFFPLALFSAHSAFVFCGIGVLFHIANAYVFGLNRFLWAWTIAYPALFYCVLAV